MRDIIGLRIGARLQAVEHIDLRRRVRRQRRPDARALAQLRDEKIAAARGVERGRGRLDADSISVGLDDGGASGRRRAARQRAPIVGERGEIDGQDA